MTHHAALPLAHQTTLRWLVTTGGTPHPSDLPHLHALAADGLAHHDADDGTWRATDRGRAVWHGRGLLDALAGVLGVPVDDLPTDQPWNEGQEQRMSHVAETRDDETGRSQPLLPRRDR